MSEHAVMTLLGIASIAIAVSGFSGVVAVFGGRAEGEWSPEARFRTTNMLILSLGACLLCFVPLALELFELAARTLWIVTSGALIAFCAFYFVYTAVKLRNPELRRPGVLIVWVRYVYFACLALAIALQALNVADAGVQRGAGPFVGGLLLLLIPAGLQFAFLVLTPLTTADSD